MSKTNYKWELRRGSRKEICPCCGQRRFVPYVSSKDHATPAGPEYGRCDREQNCGYHRYPNGVQADPNTPVVKIAPRKPLRFYNAAVRTDTNTKLFSYACRLIGYEEAMRIWSLYHIGAFGSATIFWQISKGMEVRAGKAIAYGEDGHRIKTTNFPAWWLHRCKQTTGWFEGEELRQCFFGEHLLAHKEFADRTVGIVESEKTAALMMSFVPDVLWLACGGSHNLKNKDVRVLEGRTVRLYPDNGVYDYWLLIANEHGWSCDMEMEKHPVFAGCDLLDYYEQLTTNRHGHS